MARHKLIAFTNAVPGREAEYDRWYDEQHLADVLAIRGVKSAQRYKLAQPLNGDAPGGYLAIYDVECDDPAAFAADLYAAAGTMVMSDAMDAAGGFSGLFAEHGAPLTK